MTDLTNRYELMGYAVDAQPMMGTMTAGSECLVEGFAGFHRNSALESFGQTFYIIDIYEFDTPLDRRVARNLSNHHKLVNLSQTINDYVSEVVNAANADEILKTETAISELAWRLAEGDKRNLRLKIRLSPKLFVNLVMSTTTFRHTHLKLVQRLVLILYKSSWRIRDMLLKECNTALMMN